MNEVGQEYVPLQHHLQIAVWNWTADQGAPQEG